MNLSRFLSLIAFVVMAGVLGACTKIAPTHLASLTPPAGVQSSATGSATARLLGVDLNIEGDYKNLSSAVTSVRLELANGNAVSSLQASGGNTGSFSRTVTLSADEITALNNGELVIVVYSENYPVGATGELRGVLAPA